MLRERVNHRVLSLLASVVPRYAVHILLSLVARDGFFESQNEIGK